MKEQMVEEIGKEIKDKNTMSKEYEGKVHKRIFSNILIAIFILIYLIIAVLGSQKIENDVFIVDLKVCSIIISLLSIFIFERSYRNADGRLCVYGIETLMLAILTLVGVYVFQIMKDMFAPSIVAVAIIVPIYYLIKSIGIYIRSKKKYAKEQNDIKEIVKEELPETIETKRRRDVLESQMQEYNRLNNISAKTEPEEDEKEDDQDIVEEKYNYEEDSYEEAYDAEDENDGEEDPYPRIVKSKSKVIKTSPIEAEENDEIEEDEELIIFNDEYREKKVDTSKPKKETAKKTTTKKATTSKKSKKDEEPVEKKTTAKKSTTSKTAKKDEKPVEKKTATKKSTTSKTTKKDEEKPVAKKTTTKKSTTTTKKTTSTKKKTTTEK